MSSWTIIPSLTRPDSNEISPLQVLVVRLCAILYANLETPSWSHAWNRSQLATSLKHVRHRKPSSYDVPSFSTRSSKLNTTRNWRADVSDSNIVEAGTNKLDDSFESLSSLHTMHDFCAYNGSIVTRTRFFEYMLRGSQVSEETSGTQSKLFTSLQEIKTEAQQRRVGWIKPLSASEDALNDMNEV